jgi:hypothetical protein
VTVAVVGREDANSRCFVTGRPFHLAMRRHVMGQQTKYSANMFLLCGDDRGLTIVHNFGGRCLLTCTTCSYNIP